MKEEMMLEESAQKYEMHLKEISAWKKQLLQQSVKLFDQKHKEDGSMNG